MRIVIAIIALLLLFGCNGEEPPPPAPVENVTPEEGKPPPLTVVIEEQENQTAEGNFTIEENGEVEENISFEMEYIHDPNQTLGVYFIYVGDDMLHGDAILIKKGDLDVLVDAGSEKKGEDVVDFLRSRKVDDIELLISTNADPRHYGGIKTVANEYQIEELWWTGDTFGDSEYLDTITTVEAEAKNTYTVYDGHSAELNGINFEILNPSETERFDDVNNDAIVTRVTDRNFSLLLTSGIQTGAQGDLTNTKEEKIKNLIIQAPYYGVGAGTSNIGVFLIKSKPEAMIISGSADERAANGGSREPFERLMEQHGVPWYENYVNGTVRVSTDGYYYDIRSLGFVEEEEE